MALLQVNKTVEAEAAPVLYGENVWRVTVHAPHVHDPSSSNHESVSLWSRRAKLFRHIEIMFHQGDIDAEWFSSYTASRHLWRPAVTRDWLIRMMHEGAKNNMRNIWRDKLSHAKEMQSLRTVTFDVGSLYCHVGCCRAEMVSLALDGFHASSFTDHGGMENLKSLAKAGTKFMVKGLKRSDEKEFVRGLGVSMTIVEE